jgi:sterol desaturase/sphingolipid hydroxylase (fatty acid hydroxylase superfamily)
VVRRWLSHAALGGLNIALAQTLVPLTAVALALGLAERDAGLLRRLDAPWVLAVGATLVAQDLRAWLWHRLLHASPALWRIHRVHHTDVDFDITTELRFHPLEMLGAVGTRLAVIALLGPPVAAVVLHELLTTVVGFLSHANARLPAAVERAARRVLVTPDHHRIHHSASARDLNANFATIFSFWDRWFGTFRGEPDGGHAGMRIGDPECQDAAGHTVRWLLAQPFLPAAPAAASTLRGAPAADGG